MNGFYDDWIAPIVGGAKDELKSQGANIGRQVVIKYLDKNGVPQQAQTVIGADGKPVIPANVQATMSQYQGQQPDYTPWLIGGGVGLLALVLLLKKR